MTHMFTYVVFRHLCVCVRERESFACVCVCVSVCACVYYSLFTATVMIRAKSTMAVREKNAYSFHCEVAAGEGIVNRGSASYKHTPHTQIIIKMDIIKVTSIPAAG